MSTSNFEDTDNNKKTKVADIRSAALKRKLTFAMESCGVQEKLVEFVSQVINETLDSGSFNKHVCKGPDRISAADVCITVNETTSPNFKKWLNELEKHQKHHLKNEQLWKQVEGRLRSLYRADEVHIQVTFMQSEFIVIFTFTDD